MKKEDEKLLEGIRRALGPYGEVVSREELLRLAAGTGARVESSLSEISSRRRKERLIEEKGEDRG